MSIAFSRDFFVNPEPITVKGIKTYNPKLLRIYTSKGGEEYPFDPVEEKVTGTALGTIYQKKHQIDSDKRWMGKVGEPRGGFRNDPESTRTRTRKDINLDTIYEKLSYDLFQELGRGLFEVPKTHLSSQPIQNDFLKGHALAMDWQARGIHDSLRIMSYYIEGYQDLKHANTLDGDATISFMDYLKKYHCPPEKVVTPEGKAVPIEGIVELLAIGRCLADTDLLGGRGLNAGFRWVYNEKEEIQSAKVIKIDPGYALNFTAEEDSQDGCVNWVVNTQEGLGLARYHLEDLKDLQTSNGNRETTVSWEALTHQQKDQFLSALLNASRYLEREDILTFLFYREGCFHYAETAHLPEEHVQRTQAEMRAWIKWQLEIYDEPLEAFLERKPEQLLRIRYIDDLGELPLPMSERSLPIRELFSNLALVIPEEERHKEIDGFQMPQSETRTVQIDQLFSKETKKVVITGESGTGKSTLCQKIAHDWASGKLFSDKFDAVFWIPLGKLNGKVPNESADIGLADYVATEILKKPELAAPLLDLIQEFKVLFVLDGFDEASNEVKSFLNPIFEEDRFYLLLTARPETDGLPDWSHVKNTGFSSEHIEHYIEKFFEEKNLSFLNKLKSDPPLFALAKNPFQLQMLCHMEKEGVNTDCRTDLYQTMIRQMLKWESERRGSPIEKEILLPIGKAIYLAWGAEEALSVEHFQEALQESCYTLEDCMQTGLMKGCEFSHASIEEYLIAYFLSSVSDEELESFLSKTHKEAKNHNILRFLCGTLYRKDPENAQKFFRFFEVIKENLHSSLACLNECEGLAEDLPQLQAVLEEPDILNDAIEYLLEHQCMNAIKWLHEKQPNALGEFRNKNSSTFLMMAGYWGSVELLDWIEIHIQDELEKTNPDGRTPLDSAALNGQVQAMQWLYDKNPSLIQKTSIDGGTPLYSAALNGHVQAMQWLYDKDPSLVQKTRIDGGTPMHFAAINGHVQAMQWLYDKDPSLVQKTSIDGGTPMHWAIVHGHMEAMQWLHDKDPSLIQKTSIKSGTPMDWAAFDGNLKAMQWLHEKDPSLVQKTQTDDATLMHVAATGGQVKTMQWLHDKDPSLIQKTSIDGGTPMHVAAINGHVEAIQWLHDKDPSLIQKMSIDGLTPMHVAAINGHVQAMQWLHAKDPSLIQKTSIDGGTTMEMAALNGDLEAMQWLHDKDPSLIQKKGTYGGTPMHVAVLNGDLKAMQWLHDKDPSLIQKKGTYGGTTMEMAALNRDLEAMRWLHDKDPSLIQKRGTDGGTTMEVAASNGDLEAMQWLHDKDPSLIQKRGFHGGTPMHMAAFHGKINAMVWLYEIEPSLIASKNQTNETALDIAKSQNQLEAIEFLKSKIQNFSESFEVPGPHDRRNDPPGSKNQPDSRKCMIS